MGIVNTLVLTSSEIIGITSSDVDGLRLSGWGFGLLTSKSTVLDLFQGHLLVFFWSYLVYSESCSPVVHPTKQSALHPTTKSRFRAAMSSTLTSTHRSKTLPTSLDALPVASKHNSHFVSTQPRKARTVVVSSAPGLVVGGVSGRLLSPLTSPRHEEREDPFSLGSFFPSRPGSPSNEPLSWLSPTEEMVQEAEEEEVEVERKADVDGIVPSRSLSLTALDDYAKEVIAKEERLGILSLSESNQRIDIWVVIRECLLTVSCPWLPINIYSQYASRSSCKALLWMRRRRTSWTCP